MIDSCDVVIGHNIIGYDIPVLERLLNVDFQRVAIEDTLTMSRLEDQPREGGHSLKAWGNTLNFPKGDYNDWTQLTDEMVSYCVQDTKVTRAVYNTLRDKLHAYGKQAVELEYKVQGIISKQILNGWMLDLPYARGLVAQLMERKNDLEDEVRATFRPLPQFMKEVTPKYKKCGELSTVGLKFLGDDVSVAGGVMSRVEFPEFVLGSRIQIGKQLMHFGWKPTEFTATGKPVVDESTLESVTDIPEAVMIQEYLTVQKRLAQVESWIEACSDQGRVHGYVNTLGAITNRMTHSKPNLAQVPASHSPYGVECRSCWIVPKGYKLVGADASGLELRMLAHYMNDDDYTKEVVGGDIHTANQNAAGLATRDQAKTFIYAFLYGAGDAKIGSIVGGSGRAGGKLKKKFLDNTPALEDLKTRVEKGCKKGYLTSLDGRRLQVRSPHAALNTLLQGAGAVYMKKAQVILNEYATLHGLDYKLVGTIHDEFQYEVREDHATAFGRLAVASMEAAGIQLGLRCPTTGEYKVGNNWSQTH